MGNTRARFLIIFGSVLILTAVLTLSFSASVQGAGGVPKIISYQGRLTDANDNLLGGTGTTFYLRFSIHSASSGGTQLWPAGTPCTHSLSVKNGVFNAGVGDVSECADVLDYDFTGRDAVYLEIKVSSDNSSFETLTPRQRINAAAFSLTADTLIATSTQSRLGTTSPISTSLLTLEATTTTVIPLSIRASSGQTADLFQVQDAAGTDLFTITGSGRIGIATSTPGAGFGISTSTYIVGGLGIGIATTTSNNLQVAGDIQVQNITINGTCSGCTSTPSGFTDSGTYITLTTTADQLNIGGSSPISPAVLSVNATSSTAAALILRAAASPTANIFEIQNSAGTQLLTFSAGGEEVLIQNFAEIRRNILEELTHLEKKIKDGGELTKEEDEHRDKMLRDLRGAEEAINKKLKEIS